MSLTVLIILTGFNIKGFAHNEVTYYYEIENPDYEKFSMISPSAHIKQKDGQSSGELLYSTLSRRGTKLKPNYPSKAITDIKLMVSSTHVSFKLQPNRITIAPIKETYRSVVEQANET